MLGFVRTSALNNRVVTEEKNQKQFWIFVTEFEMLGKKKAQSVLHCSKSGWQHIL